MNGVLPHIRLETGNQPAHSIIWLHGLGADGSDFVPVAETMQLPVPVRYLFPHAPEQPVTINGGRIMRAWYDITASGVGVQQDEDGIRASQTALEAFIAQEIRDGIATENIFLAGFSQGGAIALHTGLRQSPPLGGIIALSTYLPLPDSLPREAGASLQRTPLFMAHGRSDPVVPYGLGHLSAGKLKELGCPLEWHEYAMPHSVCMEEIRDIETWLTLRITANHSGLRSK